MSVSESANRRFQFALAFSTLTVEDLDLFYRRSEIALYQIGVGWLEHTVTAADNQQQRHHNRDIDRWTNDWANNNPNTPAFQILPKAVLPARQGCAL